jgi:hypothetical protein
VPSGLPYRQEKIVHCTIFCRSTGSSRPNGGQGLDAVLTTP